MINRRTLLTSATAVAAVGAVATAGAAQTAASDLLDVKIDPFDMTPQEKVRHPGTHFAKLAQNSYQDFANGMRRGLARTHDASQTEFPI